MDMPAGQGRWQFSGPPRSAIAGSRWAVTKWCATLSAICPTLYAALSQKRSKRQRVRIHVDRLCVACTHWPQSDRRPKGEHHSVWCVGKMQEFVDLDEIGDFYRER
jgi:hypothetical protein